MAAPSIHPLLNEILDFLTTTPTPEKIIEFNLSEITEERALALLELNQGGRLSAEERAAIEEFMRLGHFMDMLKIRARQKLAHN